VGGCPTFSSRLEPPFQLAARSSESVLQKSVLFRSADAYIREHLAQYIRIADSERSMRAMILQPVKRAVVLLLGFVLAWQGAFPVSAKADQNALGTKSSCCCLGCDSTGCATPACCARPSRPSPATAPVTPSTPQNELHALAVSAALLLTLPSHETDVLCTTVSSRLGVATVPIFQRHCSYLI
jgi:hypothetical protein